MKSGHFIRRIPSDSNLKMPHGKHTYTLKIKGRKKTTHVKHKHRHKKKYGVTTGKLKQRNLQGVIETKTKTISPDGDSRYLDISAGTASRPVNSTIIVPGAWASGLEQGLAAFDGQMVGQDVTDRYLNFRMRLDFDDLQYTTTPFYHGITNLKYIQGWCHDTLIDYDPASIVEADFTTRVGRMLVRCNMGSDFLEYQKPWKNVTILKRGFLRGRNKNERLNPSGEASAGASAQAPVPAPLERSFNWTLKRKTNLVEGADGPPMFYRNKSWIPFLVIYSTTLRADAPDKPLADEVPKFTGASKIWYADA